MKKSHSLLVILLFCSDLVAKDLPAPELQTLPNGMKIAWFKNDHFPVVDMMFYFPSGSRQDPVGKSGVFSLLTEVLDKGAAGKSASQVSAAIETLGATRFVSGSEDFCTVGIHGLSMDTSKLFGYLSDFVTKPDFIESEIKKEKKQLLERWAHLGDYTEGLASLGFSHLINRGTVYGRGGFVSSREFEKIGRQDVVNYYHTYFRPEVATLVVAGRVEREILVKQIEELSKNWAPIPRLPGIQVVSARPLVFSHPKFSSVQQGEIVVIDRPGVNQAQVRFGFEAPRINSPDHYPLVLGNTFLGEYFNSKLNALIRDQLGLTYSIHSGFDYSKDFARFRISSFTKTESVGKVLTKIQEVLREMEHGKFSAEEVEMARAYLVGSYPLATSTLSAIASRWLSGLMYGFGPDYLNEFVPRIKAVSPEQVRVAFSRLIKGRVPIIVLVGEGQAIKASLSKEGFKKIKLMTVKQIL